MGTFMSVTDPRVTLVPGGKSLTMFMPRYSAVNGVSLPSSVRPAHKRDLTVSDLKTKYTDEKLLHAISKLRTTYNSVEEHKASRKIVLVAYITPPPPSAKARPANATQHVRCSATTLKNKPCPFRATCGKFCKKHKL